MGLTGLYGSPYSQRMPTALHAMQPWRRALVEAGISLTEIAALTGKSVDTVYAYSRGVRRPPTAWVELVIAIAEAHVPVQEEAS